MRWNFILIVFFSLLMGACASKRQAPGSKHTRPAGQSEKGTPENRPRQQENRPGGREAPSRQQDRQARTAPNAAGSLNTEEYIRIYSSVAIEEMKRSGVPASITLAQGILESGNGNSRLARKANNHFGIKCTPDWKGGKTYKDDDRRNDCFRVYASAKESYRDHSQFLKRGRYAFLFKLKPTDYKGWARGLKKAGYATNPRYPQLLISLIERYELYYFDQSRGRKQEEIFANNEETREEPAESPANGTATAGGTAASAPAAIEQAPTAVTGESTGENDAISTAHYFYTVKPGDTLFAISKRFNITVDELRQWNSLSSNAIDRGQRLRVSR